MNTSAFNSVSGPRVGDPAPELSLPDSDGRTTTLTQFRDGASTSGARDVLVVFYPFAFSGICTGELCALRDELTDLDQTGVQLLAVSCDPTFALKAWAEQQAYSFPLLSDFWPHGEVARRFGVMNETIGAPNRGSFLIDTDGIVRWSVINGPGQARDLAEYRRAVAELAGSRA